MKRLGELFIWILSFFAAEDLTRLDRNMRIIGLSVLAAVVLILFLCERYW